MTARRRLTAALIYCAILAAAPRLVWAQTASAPQAAVRAALLQWTAAFNARDTAHVCELFSPDLLYDYQGMPERDYGALCANLRRVLGDRTKTLSYSPRIKEILVVDDIAIVRLVWTLTKTRPGAPSPATVSQEIGLDVFRRQSDGWKIIRYLAYPAEP